MPDREKVIEALQYLISGECTDTQFDYLDEIEAAIAMLKEQEPVKPCVATDTWICPKCGHTLESQYLIDDKENPQVLVHERYNFCPNCGRMVKWNEL